MPPPPGYAAEDPIIVNNPDDSTFGTPHTTFLADGGFVVVWTDSDDNSTQGSNVRAQVFDVSGAKVGDDFLVHEATAGNQNGGRVAPLSAGGFIVTWADIGTGQVRAQIFGESGQRVGAEFLVSVGGNPSGTPDITTLVSGNVVIVWEQFLGADGGWSGSGIHWAEFEPSGARVNGGSNTRYWAEIPHVTALDSGGFVISYTHEDGRYNDYPDGVIYQVYGPDAGNGQEKRTQPTNNVPGQQHAIANLETGGFVMVWAADVASDPFPSTDVILGQICAPDGTPIGGPFQVSTTSSGYQRMPAVVTVPGVGFAAAWQDAGSPGSPVRVQFFSNDGVKIGDEFVVQDETGHYESMPYLAADGLGSVLVGWVDDHPESGGGPYVTNLVTRLFLLPIGEATRSDDVLAGTAAADTIRGGTGHDAYLVNHVGDRPIEQPGEGIDTVFTSISYALAGNTNIERLETTDAAGTDPLHLTGNLVYNRIVGNEGKNRIDGGLGKDELIGLGGNDTYLVDNEGDRVVEAAGGGIDAVYSSVSYTLADDTEVEGLMTSVWEATVAIDLTGNSLDNQLIGNAGRNRLDGGGGRDTMLGREGDDVYVVDRLSDVVIEYAGQGADIIYAPFSYALNDSQEVEGLSARIWEATDAIDLTGNSLANYLIGNAGRNRLDGGVGNDVMYGREGDDIYVVDSAGDRVFEFFAGGADIIYSAVSYSLNDSSEVESLSTITWELTTPLNLAGNGLNNTLIGNAGANRLDGKGGADTMIGREGNDTYLVDNAGDKVFESAGGGTDVVYSAVSFTLTDGQEIEGLSTITWELTDAINLTGNGLNNYLIGNAGVNRLDGRAGNDTMQGREGADSYAFTTVLGPGNVDVILGFSAADDTIVLENNGVFVGLAAGALPASAFAIGTAAQDFNDRIIYDQATGRLFFDADGNGAGAQIQFARLDGAPIIAANDFTVI